MLNDFPKHTSPTIGATNPCRFMTSKNELYEKLELETKMEGRVPSFFCFSRHLEDNYLDLTLSL